MFLYNFIIYCIGFGIRIASVKKTKAKLWVDGRKNWRDILKQRIGKTENKKTVWFHCSSYGEFEQGKPLIEAFKLKFPNYKIVLTFYSPSGYEAFKNWAGADVICYLPLDTKRNAIDFIDIVNPLVVIFIKYEFWLQFLQQLKQKNITTYIVSAVFKPRHPFFRWYGGMYRNALQTFNTLFIQDEVSGKLLKRIGITNFKVTGDTRFDRVLYNKNIAKPIALIKDFKGDAKLIVAGSTWAKDEDLVIEAFVKLKLNEQKTANKKVKLIIAPHEIKERYITDTIEKLKQKNLSYTLYSDEKSNPNADVLILNTIGLLSKIYLYTDCSYIGGGFNGGLHNTLEPAVFGKGITFSGDSYKNFNEAVALVKLGCAKKVSTALELETAFNYYLFDDTNIKNTTIALNNYMELNAHSSQKIIDSISQKIS